ncbi:MAG TPA: WecB/TagA/CpsF family glycosyltransferase [Planctomycetota bacterium]|nr:WecB/TagA/CpsF family glycosyltransferase [Planctomycetota bacterium]
MLGLAPATTSSGQARPAFPTVELAGIPVAQARLTEVVDLLGAWLDGEVPRRVATANVDFLRLAHKDRVFRDCLLRADLVTADGTPLLWLADLSGTPLPERVAGSDLCVPLLEEASVRGARVAFLGGNPGEARAASRALLAKLPDLQVVFCEATHVNLADEKACVEIAERVRAVGADLLLVGLGCPKQDYFLERYLPRTGARVGIGVGRAFAFMAGTERRAPTWMRRVGLEWLCRLWNEPRRLAGRYVRDFFFLVPECLAAWRRGRHRSP